MEPGATFDVVMFWKQNDSGIYGRRQDMILAELARSPRVGTIVHFDNPISPEELLASYRAGRRQAADQRKLVATETVARALRRRDEPGVHRHTYVFGGTYSRRLGRPLRSAYAAHVRSVLAGHGVGTGRRPMVVWAYPTNDDLPALIDALAPALVVADVVDDNRHWYEPHDPHYARVERNYEAVLARSDVVLANCEPVAESMARFAADVRVVPNGLELPCGQDRSGRRRPPWPPSDGPCWRMWATSRTASTSTCWLRWRGPDRSGRWRWWDRRIGTRRRSPSAGFPTCTCWASCPTARSASSWPTSTWPSSPTSTTR